MEVIGISGKAGSGKDHLAKILRGHGWQNIAFAWPLKMDAMRLEGFTYEEVFVTKPPFVRDWLQRHGVAMRRKDVNYWVHQLDNTMTVLHREGGIQKFVITDVRFLNELAFVRAKRGRTIRMEHGVGLNARPYPLYGTAAARHESETALDAFTAFDFRITNDKTMDTRRLKDILYGAGITSRR